MFTGIISHIGIIESIKKTGDWVFTIATPPDFMRGVVLGASIACSGACLTVTSKTTKSFTVQASGETLRLTTLSTWAKGTRINLERALKVGDELGGHFVSGHVDGLAELVSRKQVDDSVKLTVKAPAALKLFVAAKGSVTLDGVSLTVNEVKGATFSVNIIPHTQEQTTLGDRKAGDRLNFEIDLIARYLKRFAEK